MHADVGNNHLLAAVYGAHPLLTHKKLPNPTDDEWNIVHQVKSMQELARLPDVAAFAEIAYSAADARRIVGAGKLALVLGLEVEDFGNFTRTLAGKSDADARRIVQQYLRDLHTAGVRHVFPIHLTNNAFGGTAVYNMMFLAANLLDRGEMVKFRNAYPEGVRLRVDKKIGASDPALDAVLKLPGLTKFRDALRAELHLADTNLGHANRIGLSSHGRILVQELMRMGFIIDLDHMSELAVTETMRLADLVQYPLVASHTAARELMKEPDERARTLLQMKQIAERGGMVGLGTGRAVATRPYDGDGTRVANNCGGTTRSFAQYYLHVVKAMGGRGVAIGTDMNGLPDSLGPRFGTQACPDADDRATAAAAQRGDGVRYAGGHKHNFGRFVPGGPGWPYGDVEAMTWAAIERFEALLGADFAGDLVVNPNLRNVSRMAHGFHRGQRRMPPMPNNGTDVYDDVRLAQQVFEQIRDRQPTTDPVGIRMRAAWDAYHAVEGNNPPLVKSKLGSTDFDFNLDGLAHYGLLPDMLQDLRNLGLSEHDLAPLFRGAEDYVRMWETIEAQSAVARTYPF